MKPVLLLKKAYWFASSKKLWISSVAVKPGCVCPPEIFINGPARLNPRHIRKFVRNPFVTINAGSIPWKQVGAVDFSSARGLTRKVHRLGGMAVPAFETVISL